ncbi:MAG: glycerophosphodiester phosphodiesterase [Candidatus Marinimicrobia bacterium]|nr:glycerophosphodiester phosphodiesterase [Candidatus Neomarinimicrobiota bacterium]
MHKIPIIAHRGASGYEPENTLAAFRSALTMQADAIELDVQICKSGEIVAFHDKRLKRITGVRGKIKRKKLAGLRKFDAGNGEHIPTLKEILDLCDAKININIELKSRRSALATAMVMRNSIRTGHWKNENFFVSSFFHRELRRFHEICPEIPVGLLYRRRPGKLKKRIKLFDPVAVHLSVKHIKEKWIHLAHDHGLKVYVWTVNDPDVAGILFSEGVDGFFTNYPDRLIKRRASFKV